jgi:hypothetical protein
LSIDAFGYMHTRESFQLFQRGVYWPTLKHALRRHFSKSDMLATLEHAGAPSFEEALDDETASELTSALQQAKILYLDFFTASLDHAAHATNDPAALYQVLRRLDTLTGRIWTAIQNSPMADQTIFAVVSDHGMNNVPGIFSQTFSLPDLFNSPSGGAHHVMTDRYQLSDYKLKGLDPLVHRIITPSTASFYLSGEASRYPTAWLDIDGNERTAVHLRNSICTPEIPICHIPRRASHFLASSTRAQGARLRNFGIRFRAYTSTRRYTRCSMDAATNLQNMKKLDDSWNAQDLQTFRKYHAKDCIVRWLDE